jgi:hypothetical protein
MIAIAPWAKKKGLRATAAKSGCVTIATSFAAAAATAFVPAASVGVDAVRSIPAASVWSVVSDVIATSARRVAKNRYVKRVVKN